MKARAAWGDTRSSNAALAFPRSPSGTYILTAQSQNSDQVTVPSPRDGSLAALLHEPPSGGAEAAAPVVTDGRGDAPLLQDSFLENACVEKSHLVSLLKHELLPLDYLGPGRQGEMRSARMPDGSVALLVASTR